MYQTSNQSLDKLRLLMAGACVRPLVHDANNLLGAAMAYTELAQMEPGMQAKTARQLGEVVGAITRCSKLLNFYAQLVRPLSYPAPYNLVDAVQHAVDLREYVFRVSGVQVDTVYPETFPNVQGFSAATQYATLALLLDFERGLPGGSGARKLGVNIDAAGDFARITIAATGFAPAPRIGSTSEDALNEPPLELDIDSARAAIEMQNGELEVQPGQSATILLPFTGTDAALKVNPLRD
jgi:hypothetical protein